MTREENPAGSSRPPRFLAIILILVGLPLLLGGGALALEGGSLYYLAAGLLSLVAGICAWRGRKLAATLIAVLVLGTVLWAFWEAGTDFWALLPRLWLFAVIGLWFLLPGTRRKLGLSVPAGKVLAIALAGVAICAGLGVALNKATGMTTPDPAYALGTIAAANAREHAAATSWGGDWRYFGNDNGGTHFSPLTQINPGNVGKLQVAWTYRVGYGDDNLEANLEMTPIKVGNRVYICTPFDDVIALDAVSGKEIWRYRSGTDRKGWVYKNCRAVTYYEVPGATGACSKRIFSTRLDGGLFALDADTGALCEGFGEKGMVNLRRGLGDYDHPGYYHVTSAPTLVRGKLVVGGWVADGQYWGEPSGVIRAFDAVTGQLAWAWDLGRPDRKGEPPEGETYTPSTPNSWAPMSVDEEMGLVFAPTGNSVPDYYGGNRRPFDDQYSSAVVALEADTGNVRWSFRTTHHDLWDYDVGSQPNLVEVPTAAGPVKAVIVGTKRAQLFVLDRATGKPVKQVVERKVPQGGIVPGERLSPTQPYSVGMPDLGGPRLSEHMMWGLTPFDQLWCRLTFRKSRYEGDFTPPGLDVYNIVYPGYGGGHNWGKVAYDLDRGLLITNTNQIANRARLISREDAQKAGVVRMGKDSNPDIGGIVAQDNTPVAADLAPFVSPLFTPCQQPPYGMLTAIDLKTSKVVWRRPVGSASGAGPMNIKSRIPLDMGMPMFGGPLVTRGGLVFMAATKDDHFRAFDTRTGKTVWQVPLPAGGQANPMTYMGADGRQYVVLAASGHYGTASTRGDYIIAYALPK